MTHSRLVKPIIFYIIRLLEWSGLAWNVWHIPAERVATRNTVPRSVSEPRAAAPAARKG